MSLNFDKNFKMYFALIITFSTFIFDYTFFFVHIPPENKETISIIVGVLNTGCLVTIINYFYSSTAGSAEKNKLIAEMKAATSEKSS